MLRQAYSFALGLLLCSCVWLSSAAAPELEGFHPTGGQIGSTNEVAAFGKFDPWPPSVWIDSAGLALVSTTNKGKFQAVIAADARPGPCLVRFYNAEGASEPRFFVIGSGAELADREPNDHFTNATAIAALGVTINGNFDKREDVDNYAVELKAGERLHARMESHTLMSKVDAVLRLVDSDGYQLAWNHDHATFDPLLEYVAPKDQKVIVQAFGFPYPAGSEIRLAGGEGSFYRLHLTTGQAPAHLAPRGESLAYGTPVTGVLTNVAQRDAFTLPVKKDQWVSLQVRAAQIGSPLDAWIQIQGADGKEITRADDSNGSADPALEWKPTMDGEVKVVVGSLTRRGRPDFRYELLAAAAPPAFKAVLEKGTLTLKPNEMNSVNLKIERFRGHTNKLEARVTGLPSAITATCTNVPAGNGSAVVAFIAPADAPPFQGPVVVKLFEAATGLEQVAPFELVSRSENNGVPGGYQQLAIPQVEHLWLAVLSNAPAATQAAK